MLFCVLSHSGNHVICLASACKTGFQNVSVMDEAWNNLQFECTYNAWYLSKLNGRDKM